VVFTVFILPVLPIEWHKLIFRIFYSLIYISAILSLERRDKKLIVLFLATFFIEWVSALFSLELVYYISRIANVIFFFVLIIKLISQIAKAREVTAGVVLSSVTGYLLLGLIYSIFVAVIMFKDPGAFSNVQPAGASEDGVNISTPLYYSYVTIASLGYGDICPLKPISRSLATIITVSGQFYMAVIVALLVGKFSSRTVNE
jgi:hypothetical protein